MSKTQVLLDVTQFLQEAKGHPERGPYHLSDEAVSLILVLTPCIIALAEAQDHNQVDDAVMKIRALLCDP